jgi:polyferredoxin
MLRRTGIIVVVVACVGIPLLVEWMTTPPPTERKIHIEAFRYGTTPSILRVNRGDKLELTFSTRDTGHSFFLQDYRIDAKINPASEMLEVRDPLRATEPPFDVRELRLEAGNPGLWGNLVSLSRFRCHTYCGPMHGFEQGDLIVRPNYLFVGSLGLLAAMILVGVLRVSGNPSPDLPVVPSPVDLGKRLPFLSKLLEWRPLQFVSTMPVLAGLILMILAGLIGTKVGARNIAVMMTWAVWMFLLAVVLVPLSTRIWCLVCPIPVLGEYLQRAALTQVRPASLKGRFGNRFFGMGRRWPRALRGPWLRLLVFAALGSFSASLAGQPRWTAALLVSMLVLGILMSLVWELRAFCRFVCPMAAFISLYSAAGRLMLRDRDDSVCRHCKDKPCLRGNEKGWACPYGLCVTTVKRNIDCGLCTECFKSCPHDNISLFWRRGPWTERFSSYGEAWQAVVMMVLAAVYFLTVQSPWPFMRDLANVVDKATWSEFGIYAASVFGLAFGIIPVLFWLAVAWGRRLSSRGETSAGRREGIFNGATGAVFKRTMPALIPFGLGLWGAFFVTIIMTNYTFVLYALSDPFGWGWNTLGAAGMPWIQLWPSGIPWIQATALLIGFALSLRLGYRLWLAQTAESKAALYGFAPTAGTLCLLAAGMLTYLTNY